MIGVLIVTHGRLSEEQLAAASTIAGELVGFRALALDWSEGIESARRRIADAVAELDAGDGVLVLTDMFCDTPSNAALSLRDPGKIEILSGVNLPMVVRLACTSAGGRSLDEMARWIEIKGRRSIWRCGRPARGPLPRS
ncbi:MAG TPA: PTS sugar transporter subunit IIA, partial [Thermoanaerobaculia bacterium]|nr:PTS sugar transporter subunit IIA [Thermoanaerobaculia bacterium]